MATDSPIRVCSVTSVVFLESGALDYEDLGARCVPLRPEVGPGLRSTWCSPRRARQSVPRKRLASAVRFRPLHEKAGRVKRFVSRSFSAQCPAPTAGCSTSRMPGQSPAISSSWDICPRIAARPCQGRAKRAGGQPWRVAAIHIITMEEMAGRLRCLLVSVRAVAPLPSAFSMSQFKLHASWGPQFSRCCYLANGLRGPRDGRSHLNSANLSFHPNLLGCDDLCSVSQPQRFVRFSADPQLV